MNHQWWSLSEHVSIEPPSSSSIAYCLLDFFVPFPRSHSTPGFNGESQLHENRQNKNRFHFVLVWNYNQLVCFYSPIVGLLDVLGWHNKIEFWQKDYHRILNVMTLNPFQLFFWQVRSYFDIFVAKWQVEYQAKERYLRSLTKSI